VRQPVHRCGGFCAAEMLPRRSPQPHASGPLHCQSKCRGKDPRCRRIGEEPGGAARAGEGNRLRLARLP
jgi:hypothetical protein